MNDNSEESAVDAFVSETPGRHLKQQQAQHMDTVSKALARQKAQHTVWMRAADKLRWKTETLANLANIDGCVVLDSTLNVLGFGGKIDIKQSSESPGESFGADAVENAGTRAEGNAEAERFAADPESGIIPEGCQVVSDADMNNFGTRHKTAFRLCQKHSGIVIFVISQDSDLRVFAGINGKVIFCDQVEPWGRRGDAQ